MQFTGARILTTAGPSITVHSTEGLSYDVTAGPSITMHSTEGLSFEVSCMSSKKDKRFDLLPV